MDVSFATVWEAVADELPDAVAISEPARDFTYAEFDDRAARLASALVNAGVGPGDKVACYLYNGAAYLETVFAALKIGAVPVNANYRYTGDELSALLADADAVALVFSGALAGNVAHAARSLPLLRLLVRVGPRAMAAASAAGPAQVGGPGPEPEAPEYEDVLGSARPRPAEPRPGSDELFMYTGGTTGRPKGVIWRLSDLMRSMTTPVFRPLAEPWTPGSPAGAARIAVAVRAAGRTPVLLPVVPLMHATGLFNAMGAMLAGGQVVTTRGGGLDPRHVWETVGRKRVRTLVVAGNAVCQPLVDELIAAERSGRPHDLSSLAFVVSSGTAMSDRLKRALHERADVTIADAIASSEGGPFAVATTSCVDDLPARFYPTAATTVLTADGAPVVPGSDETGVLAFGGPIPVGYYKDTARTGRTFRTFGGARYSMPGDLVRVAADGAIVFLGRGSGVINTGGEKVHPAEVEDALLAHPDVTDAAVVGVPDKTWGELVVAVVVTENRALTGEELRDAARGRLAGYKVPRRVVLLPRLPRTPTGKLEVAQVRGIALNDQKDPVTENQNDPPVTDNQNDPVTDNQKDPRDWCT